MCNPAHGHIVLFAFWGPNGLFLGSRVRLKNFFGSTHVVEQPSFTFFLSILTFDFDLILESFFTFRGPNGLFLGLRKGLITGLGSSHVVEQLSFSLFLFNFDIIS